MNCSTAVDSATAARIASHGATFPADAAQRERYAYQFYIGPREDDLVALMREMASDARAMWALLPNR